MPMVIRLKRVPILARQPGLDGLLQGQGCLINQERPARLKPQFAGCRFWREPEQYTNREW